MTTPDDPRPEVRQAPRQGSDPEGEYLQVKRQVQVRVYVRNGAVVEGMAHIHPGTYRGRVSDTLNIAPPNFLPITDATYRYGEQTFQSETLLVSTTDIVMIDASEG